MPALKISMHEIETEHGQFLCMSAGEFTSIFAPLPVSDEQQEKMKQYVQERADYYMGLPDDAELTNGEDITLAQIKQSIRANIVDVEAKTCDSAIEADSEAELVGAIVGRREAKVALSWMDGGASMAGSGNRDVPMSGIEQVPARDNQEAERVAVESLRNKNPYAGAIRVVSVEWAD